MHADLMTFQPPSLSALSDAESSLRAAYLRVDMQRELVDLVRERRFLELELAEAKQKLELAKHKTRELLRDSAGFLELTLVSVCSSEACEDLGIKTREQFMANASTIARRVQGVSGLDPLKVIRQTRDFLNKLPKPGEADVSVSKMVAVRAVNALLAACPIAELEQYATDLGLEEFGHRGRIAYDGLRAFIHRQDSFADSERFKTSGALYASGQLTLSQVATLLDVSPSDAIHLLEQHGFCRPLEQIELEDNEREQMLASIRASRLARHGAPAVSENHIARDVIASERIEGVDARRWIQQKA